MQEASFFLAPLAASPSHRAAFVGRIPGIETSNDKDQTLGRLKPHHDHAAAGLGFDQTYHADQIHGAEIALITSSSPLMNHGADGLITQEDLLLGIHVADCGALYLVDQVTGAFGLLHSGKKGTELNITGKAIREMTSNFGTAPSDLIAVLAPCIRPPHYEVNFAAVIKQQALDAGISSENYHDCGLCTASDLDRFYSYRIEKGNTGRLLALLGRKSS